MGLAISGLEPFQIRSPLSTTSSIKQSELVIFSRVTKCPLVLSFRPGYESPRFSPPLAPLLRKAINAVLGLCNLPACEPIGSAPLRLRPCRPACHSQSRAIGGPNLYRRPNLEDYTPAEFVCKSWPWALSMAADHIGRSSRRSHTESASRVRKSHKNSKKDDPAAKSTAATPPNPANVDALRKARLEYLETPEEERRSRMKYIYDQPVKQKEKDKDKDKKTGARSVVSTARRKSEGTTKRRKSKVARDDQDMVSEEEYVYGRTKTEEAPKKKKKPVPKSRSSTNVRKATSKVESGKVAVNREPPKRRHTEPARRRDSCDDAEETVITITSPQTRRRSSTVVEDNPRPSLKRSATTTAAKTEVGAKSIASTPHRKPSGPLSSIFFAAPSAPEKRISCLTCGSDDVRISKSAKLPCKHRMCHTCLRRIFNMSIKDPAHMPPRCCTDEHIHLKHVDKLFDNEFKKTFNRKFLEYTSKNRIYCVNRNCGEWIRPKDITVEHGRKIGKCKKCATQICAICNNKAHKSRDCPKDPATKQFIETAKQKGWQKCYNCSAMVELKEGCNHMTCRCTAEFCMVCGLRWKSCDCPWFNYENVDAHLGNPVRYQEEMGRRRDQEHRDETLARRMQALGVDENDARREMFGFGNAEGHHMNANFIQQAREALTTNYQNAEQAARGLLNGWMGGRENPLPGGIPGTLDETNGLLRRPSQRRNDPELPPAAAAPRPQRRGTNRQRNVLGDMFGGGRSQTIEEMENERRIQAWANGVAAS